MPHATSLQRSVTPDHRSAEASALPAGPVTRPAPPHRRAGVLLQVGCGVPPHPQERGGTEKGQEPRTLQRSDFCSSHCGSRQLLVHLLVHLFLAINASKHSLETSTLRSRKSCPWAPAVRSWEAQRRSWVRSLKGSCEPHRGIRCLLLGLRSRLSGSADTLAPALFFLLGNRVSR